MFHRTTFAIALLCAAACNNDKTDNKAQPSATVAPPATSAAATPPPSASAAPAQKVELALESVGAEMKYDKEALTVPAKSEVHLTLKNNAKLETMPHNFVLVREGTNIEKLAADGLAAGVAAGYVPKSEDVVASSPLVGPGKTVDFTFTAPKYPGKYPYVCTVMGHYLTMKGVLTVTAP